MSYPKWLTYGTGVGIEIAADDLRVVAAKVRPGGITVLDTLVLERVRERQAVDWGAEYSAFLRKVGGSHLAATVILPRQEVIVRQLSLPGVKDEDLAAAIGYQIDGLHPYPEDEVICDWARAGSSHYIITGIARRETIDKYSNLFAEAGITVKSLTTTAAAFYTALRVYEDKPPQDFLALQYRNGGSELEAYGESSANAAFSNLFDTPSEAIANRTVGLALAELRLPPETELKSFERALPPPSEISADVPLEAFAIPYAAALHSAVVRNGLDINLLPAEKRKKDSKLVYIPTALLGLILAGLLLSIIFYDKIEERRYMASIQEEVVAVRPDANKADEFEKSATTAKNKIELLDKYRRRAPQDLDVLNELTRLLAPPVWVNSLDLNRTTVQIAGEADSAAPLLKAIDQSPLFVNSDFTMPLGRNTAGEMFRIRVDREPAK